MDNKSTKIILIFGFIGMLAVSVYAFSGRKQYALQLNNGIGNDFISNNVSREQNKGSSVSSSKKLKIYVTGEVKNPGVYEVAAGLRTDEVIKLAGGFTDAAKVEGVNLTKIARDGLHIKVPALKKNDKKKIIATGEKKPRERSFRRPNYSEGYGVGENISVVGLVEEIKIPDDTKFCVNTASFEELVKLPGIHDELARRIIEYRKDKPFIFREDLLKVRGMNQNILKKIANYIYL